MTETLQESGSDELIHDCLALSTALHHQITPLDEPGTTYSIAGQPGVAWFRRDLHDTIVHKSGSPLPDIVETLTLLHPRHLQAVGIAPQQDNSHVFGLLLLSLYLADPETRKRLDLDEVLKRPVKVNTISEEDGRHDPELGPTDVALRAWVPVLQGTAPVQIGPWTTVLELSFTAQRRPRYAPW